MNNRSQFIAPTRVERSVQDSQNYSTTVPVGISARIEAQKSHAHIIGTFFDPNPVKRKTIGVFLIIKNLQLDCPRKYRDSSEVFVVC